MSSKFKDFDQEEKQEENDFDVGYKIPDTTQISARLQEALQIAHQQEEEEDKKQGKPKKQRRSGVICCCGVPHCGIGPMVEMERG